MTLEDALEQLADRVAAKVVAQLEGRVADKDDEWITIDEACEITKLKPRWFLDHAEELPFVKHVNRKTPRVSKKGLQRWMANRG